MRDLGHNLHEVGVMQVIAVIPWEIYPLQVPDKDALLAETLVNHPGAKRAPRERVVSSAWALGTVLAIFSMAATLIGLLWLSANPLTIIAVPIVGLAVWIAVERLRRKLRGGAEAIVFVGRQDDHTWRALPSWRDLTDALMAPYEEARKALAPGLERPPGALPRTYSPRAVGRMVEMSAEKKMVRMQAAKGTGSDATTVLFAVIAIVGMVIGLLAACNTAGVGGTWA